MASRKPQQPRRPSRPGLQTDVPTNVPTRYSYQETPVEMQRPVFQPFGSPENSVIDESPVTPGSSRQPPGYDPNLRHPTPLPEEKAFEANLAAPPSRMHPAYSAPIADQAPSPHPANSTPPPRAPPVAATSPLPTKQTHPSPREANVRPPPASPLPTKPRDADSSTPVTTSTMTTDPKFKFDRADTYGSHHLPGQVQHPNAVRDPHWKNGLCEVDSLCCLGLFCPCLIYGRTTYRLSRRAEKKDPTDLLGYERCNGSCGLFAIACGVQGLLSAIHRTRIRKLYHIEGSFGADCMKGCCCCCCVVAQNEREMKTREELSRRLAGPVTTAYSNPMAGQPDGGGGGMKYAAPPR